MQPNSKKSKYGRKCLPTGEMTWNTGAPVKYGRSGSPKSKPNRPWMHGRMALNDRTAAPRRQSPCDVQFTRLPSPAITAVAARRGRGDWRSRFSQSSAATRTKGTEPPWSIHPFVGLFIHSLLGWSSTTGISIINNFTVFDDWNSI